MEIESQSQFKRHFLYYKEFTEFESVVELIGQFWLNRSVNSGLKFN